MNGLSVCFWHFFTWQFLWKISVTICWKVLAFRWLILILAPGVTFLFVILSYCTGFLKPVSSTTDSWSLFPIGGKRLHPVLTYSGILVYILPRCAFSLVGKSTICVRPRACSSDEVLRSLKHCQTCVVLYLFFKRLHINFIWISFFVSTNINKRESIQDH